MESLNSNETIAEICRRYNITLSLFYKWKDEFFEGAKQRLSGNKPDMVAETALTYIPTGADIPDMPEGCLFKGMVWL